MSISILRYTEPIDTLAVDSRYVRAPKLCDVLLGTSQAPWTLSSFKSYLQDNYCSENLDFTTEVYNYQQEYHDLILTVHPSQVAANSAFVNEHWDRIIDTYIKANSPREINIHGSVRDDILENAKHTSPPSPDLLHPAYTLILELMSGIYVQWAAAVHPEPTILPALIDSKRYSAPISTLSTEICPDSIEDGLSFYKRAHGIWGSSRVYRKIRKSNSERNSPTPEEQQQHHSMSVTHKLRWSHG